MEIIYQIIQSTTNLTLSPTNYSEPLPANPQSNINQVNQQKQQVAGYGLSAPSQQFVSTYSATGTMAQAGAYGNSGYVAYYNNGQPVINGQQIPQQQQQHSHVYCTYYCFCIYLVNNYDT